MEHLEFEWTADKPAARPRRAHVLVGVVASGNLEVLIERQPLGGACRFTIDTSAGGFGETWKAVLADFMARHAPADIRVSIHDHAASPAVVSLRLDQAMELMESEPCA